MIRWHKVFTTAILATALLIGAVGCTSGNSPLEGTQWRLVGWTLSSLNPADFTITAAFSGGTISGKSAVNTYNGSYAAGPGTAFSVGQLGSTKIGGPEPDMRAESAYMELLSGAKSFKVANGELTLFDHGGNVSLIFKAVTE